MRRHLADLDEHPVGEPRVLLRDRVDPVLFDLSYQFVGDLSETVSARASLLYQRRSDWIDNVATPQNNDLENYREIAARVQLQFKPNEALTLRLVGQARDFDGTARVFRANLFAPGTNNLVGLGGVGTPFRRSQAQTDGLNFQRLKAYNLAGTLEYDFGAATLTSVTSWWNGEYESRGDIDGGIAGTGPGFIPFPAHRPATAPKRE